MRKLVESNLIEKTKNFEEQPYKRWHLQKDNSAVYWGNSTRIGVYTLQPKQLKPYCHTETTLTWTSGSTFELELELPKISENLSQYRIVYRIQTGNKITNFSIANKETALVYYWNLLGEGSSRLTYNGKVYTYVSNMTTINEFYVIIDYIQGMYIVYLTDDPDV